MFRTLPSLAPNTILSVLLTAALIGSLSVALALGMGFIETTHAKTPQSSAEDFIDAFYSFDATKLAENMQAPEDEKITLYYQAWAKAADYAVQTRCPCTRSNSTYTCKITVTDNFGKTMGYTATDTFVLTSSEDGQITGVSFSGDDPPIFEELFSWMGEHQPGVMSGPCHLLFAGGTTPAACSKAVVAAAETFMAERSK